MSVWLASGSPRRKTLLEWSGFKVEVHPPNVDETRNPAHDPVHHAKALARMKVNTAPVGVVALAADTIVHLNDRLFEKPVDRAEAHQHLRLLSGHWHQVTTGVAIRSTTTNVFAVTTRVRFRDLTDDEIARYLTTGEADDKAGAYGIQGRAASFVAEVQGSWTNVVGLPLERCIEPLRALGA